MTLSTIKIEIIGGMIRVGSAIIVRLVTGEAIACGASISGGMAINTLQCSVCASQWKLSLIMIEGNLLPRCLIVAVHAIRGKCIGNMIGIGNVGIIVFMTAETIMGKACKLVIDVTIAA